MIPINGQFLNATQSSSLSSTTPTQLEERKSGEEDSTVEKMANLGINGLLGNESKARKLLNFSIIPTGRKIVLEDLPPNLLGSIGSYLGSGKNSGILEFFINIPKEPLGTINTNMFEHNREAVLGERLKIDGRLVGTILKNAGNSLSAISPYLQGILTAIRMNVRSLDLSDSTTLTDTELQAIAQFFPNLIELNLSRCSAITDTGLQHLTALLQLQYLDLSHCDRITDTGLQHLRAFTQLQHLDLSHCNQIYHITDTGLQHLTALLQLQYLDFRCGGPITDEGKNYLISKIPLLHIF